MLTLASKSATFKLINNKNNKNDFIATYNDNIFLHKLNFSIGRIFVCLFNETCNGRRHSRKFQGFLVDGIFRGVIYLFYCYTFAMNEWYDYFFEHRGICPRCGKGLTMHMGCVNYQCKENIKRRYPDFSHLRTLEEYKAIINNLRTNTFYLRMVRFNLQEKMRNAINNVIMDIYEEKSYYKFKRERFQE